MSFNDTLRKIITGVSGNDADVNSEKELLVHDEHTATNQVTLVQIKNAVEGIESQTDKLQFTGTPHPDLHVKIEEAESMGVYLEDSQHGSADNGIHILAVRKDSEGTNANLDGDYTSLQTDENGYLKVKDPNAVSTPVELLHQEFSISTATALTVISKTASQNIKIYGISIHNNESVEANDQILSLKNGTSFLYGATNNGIYLAGRGGVWGLPISQSFYFDCGTNTDFIITTKSAYLIEGCVWYTKA